MPITFRYADAVDCRYCDSEIKFFQLFRHPQNWRYSSASQHQIPVLSTNLTVHFQTFQTFISRLTSVLEFAIIFDTISKNKHNKTHLRYYSAYDNWYDKNGFLTLECATSLEWFAVKLTVRTLLAAGNFSGRQTDIACSSEFCKETVWLFRNIEVWKYVSASTVTCGTVWHSWLKLCSTSRKVAVPIPESLIENFHWHNHSGRTVALKSTQPLTEMSSSNIFWR